MSSKSILRGSYRKHPKGSVLAGAPASSEVVNITLILRRRQSAPEAECISEPLSYKDFAELHGAGDDDILAVEEFASRHGFSVSRVDRGARSITISGPLSDLAAIFEAKLHAAGWRPHATHAGRPSSSAGRIERP